MICGSCKGGRDGQQLDGRVFALCMSSDKAVPTLVGDEEKVACLLLRKDGRVLHSKSTHRLVRRSRRKNRVKDKNE